MPNQEIINYIKKTRNTGWIKKSDEVVVQELIKNNFGKEEIFDAYKYLIENENYRVKREFFDIRMAGRGLSGYFPNKKRHIDDIEWWTYLYTRPIMSEKEKNKILIVGLLIILICVVWLLTTGNFTNVFMDGRGFWF